ncbi:MAG: tRNA (N6-isopentenyl adenosine(37)-C2)-methylthiotransferase MiaB [Spirochaetaceae bacterium]|nr:tRNA (N6-isopentenyl adenosine(37)-C2)-methylthiotransferase MiaB [Spirochaetaceae bacterium]|tara:strand:- start:20931 stop:22352 length:1422 start_codon:yes stop_codon:yes gene_type:complete
MNEAPEKTNRLFVETYGCQMNEYDSGIVRRLFGDRGYSVVVDEKEADVILLNTCAVREKAHERVYGRLQSLNHLKRKNPGLVIGVLGCMAQNLGEDLHGMGLPVDLVLGPDNYRDLPELVEGIRTGNGGATLARLSSSETYEEIEPEVVSGCLAFVTIMRGCDNFCSFCVVPFTRGRERSRNPDSIVQEIQNLIQNRNVAEVTLLGQNVNSYKMDDGLDFAGLVRRILNETDIKRIRFTSPHPHDFPLHLLELMASEPRFCNHIHLPLQAGSSEVLNRMNRDYSKETFLNLVKQIRTLMPDVGLTTDIIVGFPGETEEQFQETLELVRACEFDMAYMFKYSEREHTLARKKYADDVSEDDKLDRLGRLISLQTTLGAEKNKREVGRSHKVLVEGTSKRSSSDWMGRTDSGKVVVFSAPEGASLTDLDAYRGTLVDVEIESCTQATLKGKADWSSASSRTGGKVRDNASEPAAV